MLLQLQSAGSHIQHWCWLGSALWQMTPPQTPPLSDCTLSSPLCVLARPEPVVPGQPGADTLKGSDRDTCCDVMKCDAARTALSDVSHCVHPWEVSENDCWILTIFPSEKVLILQDPMWQRFPWKVALLEGGSCGSCRCARPVCSGAAGFLLSLFEPVN